MPLPSWEHTGLMAELVVAGSQPLSPLCGAEASRGGAGRTKGHCAVAAATSSYGSQPRWLYSAPPRLSLSLEARPKRSYLGCRKDGLPTVTVLGQGQGPGAPEPWTRMWIQPQPASGLPGTPY